MLLRTSPIYRCVHLYLSVSHPHIHSLSLSPLSLSLSLTLTHTLYPCLFLPIFLLVYLSNYLPICLSIYISLYLSVYLCMSPYLSRTTDISEPEQGGKHLTNIIYASKHVLFSRAYDYIHSSLSSGDHSILKRFENVMTFYLSYTCVSHKQPL